MPEKESNQKNKMRRTLQDEEKRIWTQAIRDVKALKQPISEKTPAKKAKNHPLGSQNCRDDCENNYSRPAVELPHWQGELKEDVNSQLKYEKSSRQMGRAQRLRWQNGEDTLDARLDLHGLNQTVAHKRLVDFILATHKNGQRSLLVITGKGRGIIRGAIGHWLEAPLLADKILAVSQASPKDGGEGALYILLRKASRTKSSKKLS